MIRDSQFFFKVCDCDDAKKYFFRFFFNLDTNTEYIVYTRLSDCIFVSYVQTEILHFQLKNISIKKMNFVLKTK